MRSGQSKASKLIPARTQGSRSPCSNVTAEEFFVSPNHFQRFCVAHLDADSTSDLPADVAQPGGLSRRRDRSWPTLGIQQVLRNLRLCGFAPSRARLGNNYRLAQFLGKPVRCNVPQPVRLLKRKRRRRLQADQVPVYRLVFPRTLSLLRDRVAHSGRRNNTKPAKTHKPYTPREAQSPSLRGIRTRRVRSSREWGASPTPGCAEKR